MILQASNKLLLEKFFRLMNDTKITEIKYLLLKKYYNG